MSLDSFDVEHHLNLLDQIQRKISEIENRYAEHSLVHKEIQTINFHLDNLEENLHDVLRYEV